MLRIEDDKIHVAAGVLIERHGAAALAVVERHVDEACRQGDGLGSVAWSIIGAAVRRRLDEAARPSHDVDASRPIEAAPLLS